jgi:23S rRNA (cytosine1962-C5)-methyltransferase
MYGIKLGAKTYNFKNMGQFKNVNLVSQGWENYSLLDSGDGKKLEKFGEFLIIRPEPQAIWRPLNLDIWKNAHAEFAYVNGSGKWIKNNLPPKWEIKFKNFSFFLKTNNFKHLGIFPEQLPHWLWAEKVVSSLAQPKILNLFAYTGIINLFLAQKGGNVVHIDSSVQSNRWALENINGSRLNKNIKVLLDDAFKFSKRELRRGNFYDGIILDPPAFGRGAKGEVWKIEKNLPQLLEVLYSILKKEKNSFFLLKSYAAGYSSWSLKQLVESYFGNLSYEGEFGEMQIKEKNNMRLLPSGIYVRFILK